MSKIFSFEELSEMESLHVYGGFAPGAENPDSNGNCGCTTFIYCNNDKACNKYENICAHTSLGCGSSYSGQCSTCKS